MKKIYLLLALIVAMSTNAQGIVSWNFNSSNTNASTGVGILSFVGGTGSSSYVNNGGTQALAFADFPAVNVGSGTAGIRFATSTSGYTGISVTFDTYGHNQSSKWQQYEYTTNGSTWIILSNNAGGLTSGFLPVTLNFPASCDNNPNFAFRIVSIFNPSGGTQYEQVQGGGYNGSNGKWYFDNVAITGATLNLKSNKEISGLKIYPNPAKNVLNIASDSFEAKTVAIYNVLGKVVLSEKVTNAPVNVANLAKGVYVVKVTEEGKTATRKLVIE
ncbi:Por secretion system C-terminal sorting domain-containing protein [Flavobacterium swingsii]|jgi:hypothetical protein|uniref:Por secretion system C-terminal sorting domain-containing protein n=1 Tax=Flavobacterium swingsii TaxID=498292 RepID=A0A1I0XKQ2_9FLAO|nr:T9SS type A sorting domain-containing protein [Flavobacterium swingsii]SFB00798.1 Por secretion system C-terminal sorting domain-containing protein [Flavobacterium swingsii]